MREESRMPFRRMVAVILALALLWNQSELSPTAWLVAKLDLQDPWDETVTATVWGIVGLLLVPAIARLWLGQRWEPMAASRFLRNFPVGAAAGFGAFLLSLWLAGAVWEPGFHARLASFPVWMLALSFGLATGVLEESALRGFLQGVLFKLVRVPFLVFVVQGIVFALLHYPKLSMPNTWAYYLVFGFVASFFRWRTESLWWPIGLHVGINVANILFLGSPGRSILPTVFVSNRDFEWTVAGLLCCMVLATIAYDRLRRGHPATERVA
jgi:membrane protease YdiL (CAAX protease family)